MTLVELLVAAGLSLLLLGLIATVLLPSLRAQLRGGVRAELQQTAFLALGCLAADVGRSASSGISLAVSGAEDYPVLLSVMRMQDVLPEGRPVWESRVAVYSWDATNRRLLRREWPPEPPALALAFDGRAMRLSPEDLLAIARTPQQRVLVQGLDEFEVTHGGGTGPAVSQPLRVTLKLSRREAHSTSAETLELSRTLFLPSEP